MRIVQYVIADSAVDTTDLMKHLIVGIDPGKTSAIACLDLDGGIVKVKTGRYVGMAWFVNEIQEAGFPVVISSDKEKANSLVSKLSAVFDAVLFVPSTDISVSKKKVIAEKYVSNLHERDALASAKMAFNAYANKLRHIESSTGAKSEELDMIKARVIKKYSIYEAANNMMTGRRLVRKA